MEVKKSVKKRDRAPETINKEGLTSWQASDSKPGITRSKFPTFRVDPEDLEAINDHCESEGVERSVLMRQLIKTFLQSLKEI